VTTPRDSQPLGFACHWGPDRNQTWSGSPVRLLAALAAMDDVVDLDVTIPRPARDLLRGV